MSTRDVRDMLGLSADSAGPKSKKSKKSHPSSKPPAGVSRELYALMGERAPPIQIQKPQHHYRKAPKKRTHNVKWNWTPFRNQARTDGLELGHWVKTATLIAAPADENGDANMEGQSEIREQSDVAIGSTEPYRFARYNLQAEPPKYTDEQYSANLVHDSWSKEETDYLMEQYKTLYGKWPVVHDRYEWTPEAKDAQTPPTRTLEELKARFYDVSYKMMSIHTPQSNMTQSEFSEWEMMKAYDPRHETQRKAGIERLLRQDAAAKREQDFLISELRRIYERQEESAQKLKDLRERLDHHSTDDKPGSGNFTTSSEINQVYQRLMNSSRSQQMMKRRSVADGASTNTNGQQTSTSASGNQGKRNSLHNESGTAVRRNLAPRAESRFGVSTHDKLTSGINFKSERINKLRTAKSQIQTQKIADILVEAGIPDTLQMPTTAVCDGMEALITRVHMLLDARKQLEKEKNDIAVAQKRKQMQIDTNNGVESSKMDESQVDGENDAEPEEEEEEEEEEEKQKNDDDDDEEGDDDGDVEVKDDSDAEDEEDNDDDGDEDDGGAEVDQDDDGIADDDDDDAEPELEEDEEEEVDEDDDHNEGEVEAADEDEAEDQDGVDNEEEEDADEEEDDDEAEAEAGDDDEPEEAEDTPIATRSGVQKRSASVLSDGSNASGRPGSKRQKSARG